MTTTGPTAMVEVGTQVGSRGEGEGKDRPRRGSRSRKTMMKTCKLYCSRVMHKISRPY